MRTDLRPPTREPDRFFGRRPVDCLIESRKSERASLQTEADEACSETNVASCTGVGGNDDDDVHAGVVENKNRTREAADRGLRGRRFITPQQPDSLRGQMSDGRVICRNRVRHDHVDVVDMIMSPIVKVAAAQCSCSHG
jgi:hypothetical protein